MTYIPLSIFICNITFSYKRFSTEYGPTRSSSKGIMCLSAVIIAVGRIVGESAALVFTAGTIAQPMTSILNSGRSLSVHMYVLSGEGLYIKQTYATATVLMLLVLILNGISSLIARKLEKNTTTEE